MHVCCSGNAGESAGRRGSRIGDLAIPAQVTRGPRSRTSCRNNRTHLRTNSSYASSSASSQRRDRRGTSALCHRRQATLGSSRRRVPLIRACYLFFDIALALSLARRSIFDDQSLPACTPIRFVALSVLARYRIFVATAIAVYAISFRSPIDSPVSRVILDLVVPRLPGILKIQRRFRYHDAYFFLSFFVSRLLARDRTREKPY